MKNFLNKQREIMALLAYAAVVAALVFFVILPLITKISDINDQIQEEGMKQESVKLHISELPKIQSQYQTLQKDGDLSDALLNKNKAVVLIEKLEKIAEDSGDDIAIAVQDNAQPAKSSAKGVVAETLVSGLPNQDFLQMQITLTGNYSSIIKFMDVLEKFEYYADIISIKINKEKPSEKSAQSSFSADIFNAAPAVQNSDRKESAKISGDNVLTAVMSAVFYTN